MWDRMAASLHDLGLRLRATWGAARAVWHLWPVLTPEPSDPWAPPTDITPALPYVIHAEQRFPTMGEAKLGWQYAKERPGLSHAKFWDGTLTPITCRGVHTP